MDDLNTRELEEMSSLRVNLKSNNRLALELKAAISFVLRNHGVSISDEGLSKLVLASPLEINSAAAVVLPVPDLGPI